MQPVDIGAHVSSAGGLLPALGRGEELGADVIQIFAQNPRAFKVTPLSPERLEAYRLAQVANKKVRATYCHAPYLINLATDNAGLAEASRRSLVHNLATASAIGSSGVVLHVGSHRGAGLDGVLRRIADALIAALDEASEVSGVPTCTLLLENAAGSGGTVGRNFDELARVIDTANRDDRLGICLDTQHLFASGVPFGTFEETEDVLYQVRQAVGLERLGLIHLNDSKVAFGANRDRHENLGDGAIGSEALGVFISHPSLDGVACVLEVPGSGKGPRAEDIVSARRILEDGLARRAAALDS